MNVDKAFHELVRVIRYWQYLGTILPLWNDNYCKNSLHWHDTQQDEACSLLGEAVDMQVVEELQMTTSMSCFLLRSNMWHFQDFSILLRTKEKVTWCWSIEVFSNLFKGGNHCSDADCIPVWIIARKLVRQHCHLVGRLWKLVRDWRSNPDRWRAGTSTSGLCWSFKQAAVD